jgi:hypothetical protein
MICKTLFFFLNIHGLSDHKGEDDDFQSYVNSYDIVAFVENLNDSPGNLPEFTSPFVTKPTKRKRRGRPVWRDSCLLQT